MKYIVNNSNDAEYNLAFEEYCFTNLPKDEDYLILWINGPSIIIGKNQNAREEINNKYVEENNIQVVRRPTGGGAVYHDLGNLNYSIITTSQGERIIDLKKYNVPIMKALEKLGVESEFSGRNDLVIDGKKFAGIAQSVKRNRVLNHGAMLFDVDLDALTESLNVREDKYKSKGVKSVRSRVTNIKPYMDDRIGMEEFKDTLLRTMFEMKKEEPEEYILSEEELKGIDKIYNERYGTWEWNYGYSPDSNFSNYKRFPFGSIDVRLDIKNGVIDGCKIFGDFFGVEDIQNLEDKLKGERYEKDHIRTILKEKNLKEYFGDIELEEFIELLFD